MAKPLKITIKDHHADGNQDHAVAAIRTVYDISKDTATNLVKHHWDLTDEEFANSVLSYLDVSYKKHPDKNTYTADQMYTNMQYYMEYCKLNDYITPQAWLELDTIGTKGKRIEVSKPNNDAYRIEEQE